MTEDYKIKSEYGAIKFRVTRMPSQCGMSILHSVYFKDVKDKQKLYEFFLNEVIFGEKNLNSVTGEGWDYSNIYRSMGNWNVNKYLMTDYKRLANHKAAHLYDFCKTMGALEGDLVPNPNSGNEVRSFEFNRKSIKDDT